MSTITSAIFFIIKAIFYGLGLAFGFWLMGIITGYMQYYISLYLHDKEEAKLEIKNDIYHLIDSIFFSKKQPDIIEHK